MKGSFILFEEPIPTLPGYLSNNVRTPGSLQMSLGTELKTVCQVSLARDISL